MQNVLQARCKSLILKKKKLMTYLELSRKIIKSRDSEGFDVVDFDALHKYWQPYMTVWYNSELENYQLILGNFHHLITKENATQIIKEKQLIEYKWREGSFSYDTKETIRGRLLESEERKENAINQISILEKHIEYLNNLLSC